MSELTLNYGGKTITFQKSPTTYAIKKKKQDVTSATRGLEATEGKVMGDFTLIEVPASRSTSNDLESSLDEARKDSNVSVGTHVFYFGESNVPLIPDGTLYVVFSANAEKTTILSLFRKYHLNIIEKISDNEYWVQITQKSTNPLKTAALLQNEPTIQIAEPDFFRNLVEYAFQPPTDSLFRDQWHLENEGPSRYYYVGGTGGGVFSPSKFTQGADAKIVATWKHLHSINKPPLGDKEIVVAVIDSGFDIDHPDLYGDGTKVVAPYNFIDNSTNPRPLKTENLSVWHQVNERDEAHGTACAGVAVGATNNRTGTVGACPNARLMPIKAIHTVNEKEVIKWFNHAANNGADIISCSWGLGEGSEIGSSLKNKLQEITTKGRNGKGCIICFAAGNTDPSRTAKVSGLAADPHVICVTASTSGDKVATYSFQGKEVSIAASSSGEASITTCSVGYNYTWRPQSIFMDNGNPYTASFGGTSSACPLVAGICGLILTANKGLTAKRVKDILQKTADKIQDTVNDPNGYINGHSIRFGYGRVNALKAVQMAEKEKPKDAPIPIPNPMPEEGDFKMATVIGIRENGSLNVRWEPKSASSDTISRTLKKGNRVKVMLPKKGNWYQLAPEYVYGKYLKVESGIDEHNLDPKDYLFELPQEGRPDLNSIQLPEVWYPDIKDYWHHCTNERTSESLDHITTLVIHATVGASSSGAISVMKREENPASFHWLVPAEEEYGHEELVWACASEKKRAWHVQNKATHPQVNDGKGLLNDVSLGVEIVNLQDDVDSFSDWQLRITAQIARYCWAKYPNLKHIVSHAALDPSRRTDPGIKFPWEKFITLVLTGEVVTTRGGLIDLPSEENIRKRVPSAKDIEVDESTFKGTCWDHEHNEQ